MRGAKCLLCFLAAHAQPAVAVAQPARGPWLATGKWTVDFEDQQCIAARDYRRGDATTKFGLESRPLDGSIRAMVEVPQKGAAFGAQDARIFFGDERQETNYVSTAPSARPDHAIYLFDIPRNALQRLASAGRLKLNAQRLKLDLPVPRLAEVVKVLDVCVADLLTTWGLSKEDQARLARPPVPVQPLASYYRGSDYPRSALQRGGVGEVQARVTVGTDGKPSDCRIVRTSGHNELDNMACRVILGRARFHPAIDHQGKPMRSPVFFVSNWRIK